MKHNFDFVTAINTAENNAIYALDENGSHRTVTESSKSFYQDITNAAKESPNEVFFGKGEYPDGQKRAIVTQRQAPANERTAQTLEFNKIADTLGGNLTGRNSKNGVFVSITKNIELNTPVLA